MLSVLKKEGTKIEPMFTFEIELNLCDNQDWMYVVYREKATLAEFYDRAGPYPARLGRQDLDFFADHNSFSILIGPETARWITVWPAISVAICWLTEFCAMVATFVYIYRGIRYIEAFGSTKKIIPEPFG